MGGRGGGSARYTGLLSVLLVFVVATGCRGSLLGAATKPRIPPPDTHDYCHAAVEEKEEIARVSGIMGAGYRLAMVQVVTRHGDRTPIERIRGSPVYDYNDGTVWNCKLNELTRTVLAGRDEAGPTREYEERFIPGIEAFPGNCLMGALTAKGARQHVRNGAKCRQLYVNVTGLLSTEFTEAELYARSGNEPRLRDSAHAVLSGLYPTVRGDQHLYFDLVDEETDPMTPLTGNCYRLEGLYELYMQTPAWKNFTIYNDAMNVRVRDVFQTDAVAAFPLSDIIRCRSCHDFDVTFGGLLTVEDITNLIELSKFQFMFFPNDLYSSRLGSGVFLKTLMDNFRSNINGETTPKFSVFSGHDTTIWPLLNTINLFDGEWPPLASHILFELWYDVQNTPYIAISYNGRDLTTYIEGCEGEQVCPFSVFSSTILKEELSYEEFTRECRVPKDTQ